ncbi:MAG: ribosome-recycling factor [Candidatus Sericytochromatia bacterium]|nr:MAG: ribosome-recycling factor [Candidatus Sericytochromatia bacterium]
MLDSIFSELEEKMNKSIQALKKELASVRAGRASVNMLDRVDVEYYGTMTPVKNVANITTPDSRTIVITPFEKNMLSVIDKAIQKSDLGIMPSNDGHSIRIVIPQLTQERRNELKKVVNKIGEEGKVALRNERRTAIDKIKKLEKESKISEDESKKAQDKVQKQTDKFISEVDKLIEAKNKEILEI